MGWRADRSWFGTKREVNVDPKLSCQSRLRLVQWGFNNWMGKLWVESSGVQNGAWLEASGANQDPVASMKSSIPWAAENLNPDRSEGVRPQQVEAPLAREELLKLAPDTFEIVKTALERGDDQQVLERLPGLIQVLAVLPTAFPEFDRTLFSNGLRALRGLLPALNGRVTAESSAAGSVAVRAELASLAMLIVSRLRSSCEELPRWLDGYERGMAQQALALLRELGAQEPGGEASMQERELILLLRIGELREPLPRWVRHEASELLSERIKASIAAGPLQDVQVQKLHHWINCYCRFTDPDASLEALIQALGSAPRAPKAPEDPHPDAELESQAVEVSQEEPVAVVAELLGASMQQAPCSAESLARDIPASVAHWLESFSPSTTGELGLVYVPGARVVPHDRTRLQLNLAPLLSLGSPEQLDALIQAFFAPIQESPYALNLGLQEPASSLYESLGLFWRHGGTLSEEELSQLNDGIAIWNRCGGPGALGARMLPSRFPQATFAGGQSLVRPSRGELAVLQSVLYNHGALEPAMALIRRHHHDHAWMHRQGDPSFYAASEIDENLRWLHTQEGFYANSYAPLDCLERWSAGALSALMSMQVAGAELSPAFFPVAQMIFEQTGRVKPLLHWPGEQQIYDIFAGKEILAVTPLSEVVEAQHHSGKAFDLFDDVSILPYGLRCLEAPQSVYPNRPASGFTESLDQCLEQIEALYNQRPFSMVVAACGAYSLPLCDALRQRYGVSCISSGDRVHAYFGVQQDCTAHWRLTSRKPENWVVI